MSLDFANLDGDAVFEYPEVQVMDPAGRCGTVSDDVDCVPKLVAVKRVPLPKRVVVSGRSYRVFDPNPDGRCGYAAAAASLNGLGGERTWSTQNVQDALANELEQDLEALTQRLEEAQLFSNARGHQAYVMRELEAGRDPFYFDLSLRHQDLASEIKTLRRGKVWLGNVLGNGDFDYLARALGHPVIFIEGRRQAGQWVVDYETDNHLRYAAASVDASPVLLLGVGASHFAGLIDDGQLRPAAAGETTMEDGIRRRLPPG